MQISAKRHASSAHHLEVVVQLQHPRRRVDGEVEAVVVALVLAKKAQAGMVVLANTQTAARISATRAGEVRPLMFAQVVDQLERRYLAHLIFALLASTHSLKKRVGRFLPREECRTELLLS